MNLQQEFLQHIKQFVHLQPSRKQLLAASGGVDSVVLCDLLFKARCDFDIAHCNFQLRGEESERDERFVRSLAEKYRKDIFVERFDTNEYATTNKLSTQVAARELRYNWFHKLIEDNKFQYLITAHHANDNIETLLMNFFKGTGIAGLHSILPVQGKIFRPLLFAKKEELLNYAHTNSLQFVEDSSNSSDKYTRNYFRRKVIPMIKEVYPTVEDNLIDNIKRFTEAEELYQQAVQLHKKKLLELKGNEVHVPVLKLQKSSPLSAIVYEIIKDFGFTANQTKDVEGLLESESGKYVQSASHRIIKNRNWLIISPNKTEEADNVLIEAGASKISLASGDLHVELFNKPNNFQIPVDANVAALNADDITFPLLLRKWKQGDYFYPLGMRKKKKLSRFFIDIKLSRTDKENVWVLESNKKIIWIIGYRIDDRFKISDNTKRILKITLA